jgi:hypothetical protein
MQPTPPMQQPQHHVQATQQQLQTHRVVERSLHLAILLVSQLVLQQPRQTQPMLQTPPMLQMQQLPETYRE